MDPNFIAQVRIYLGDRAKARTDDLLKPPPNGISTIFRTTAFPLAASMPASLYAVTVGQTTTRTAASGFTVLDIENGIIQFDEAPSGSITYIVAEYYLWYWFSDALITFAINAQNNNLRRAAIDILNMILADPQGVFFKKYQTGDELVDDSPSIGRLQATRDELWKQEGYSENAGGGVLNWPQYFLTDPMNYDPAGDGLMIDPSVGSSAVN